MATEAAHFYWFAVGSLCVWRITHFFQAEDGPWDISVRLRGKAGTGFWGKLLDCFYCLSVWVAAPFACLLGYGWMERLLLWPALSASAIMLERLTDMKNHSMQAHYFEDEEKE